MGEIPTSARVLVRTPLPYPENDWTGRAEIWCVMETYSQVMVRLHLAVYIHFSYLGNGWTRVVTLSRQLPRTTVPFSPIGRLSPIKASHWYLSTSRKRVDNLNRECHECKYIKRLRAWPFCVGFGLSTLNAAFHLGFREFMKKIADAHSAQVTLRMDLIDKRP